jgi:4-aminobutyrate aminotransferase
MTTCSFRGREKMGPFMPEIYAFPFYDIEVDDTVCERECIAAIEQAFSTYLPANEVAAVVIEPIQGDIGILPAHPLFLRKLYSLCQANGILFFSEEVQQGFCRTGKFFGIENYDIVPDGIIMGKAAGGGLPLGAFMARAEIMDCLSAPAHLFTMSGNALSCAAASAAFDVYRSDEFQAALRDNIQCLDMEARSLRKRHPELVHFIRGVGMSIGIGICRTELDGSRVRDPDAAFKILYRCYERGLIVISLDGSILRIQPPLIITPEQIRQGFLIISQAMDDLKSGSIGEEVLINRAGW